MSSKNFQYKIEYLSVLLIRLLTKIFRGKSLYLLSDTLSLLPRILVKKRAIIARNNIDHVYGGNLLEKEKNRFIHDMFKSLCDVIVEFVKFPQMSDNAIKNMFINVEGLEHIDAVLKKGKGIIVTSGHIGNWELFITYVSLLGYKLNVIYREQKNPYIDKIIFQTRKRFKINPIPKIIVKKLKLKDREIMFRDDSFNNRVISHLRKNEIVGIMIDQSPAPTGIDGDFMGQKAATTYGPVVYSKRTGAPIIPVYCVRESRGKYRLIIEKPIELIKDSDKVKERLENIKRLNESLERLMKNYPEQWLWLHKRWSRS